VTGAGATPDVPLRPRRPGAPNGPGFALSQLRVKLPAYPNYAGPDEETDMSDSSTTSPKERLVSDFRAVLSDTEELLKASADATGARATELRAKIADNLVVARERLRDAEAALLEKSKAAAQATDDYVHAHPWQAVGVAAGIAFLLGLLVSRR
jgi:ElaB/YqjD/DUF883 family membrane-anchored ribosome-binding protein